MRWPQGIAALGLGVALWLPVMGAGLGQLQNRLPVRENDDTNGAIYLHHAFHDAMTHGRLSLRDPDQLLPAGYDRLRADGGNSVEMIVSGLLRLILPWPPTKRFAAPWSTTTPKAWWRSATAACSAGSWTCPTWMSAR